MSPNGTVYGIELLNANIQLQSEDMGKFLLVNELIEQARNEPVLLLASDGSEFLISEADDFEKEVEMLRESQAFQDFLDKRAASEKRISLDELEKEIEKELSEQSGTF